MFHIDFFVSSRQRTFRTSRRLFIQGYLIQAQGRSNYEGWLSDRNKKTNLSAEVESFLSGYVQMFEMSEMVKCLIQE